MIKTFSNIVREGKQEARWPRLALNNQKILSALYEAACSGQVVSLAK